MCLSVCVWHVCDTSAQRECMSVCVLECVCVCVACVCDERSKRAGGRRREDAVAMTTQLCIQKARRQRCDWTRLCDGGGAKAVIQTRNPPSLPIERGERGERRDNNKKRGIPTPKLCTVLVPPPPPHQAVNQPASQPASQ